MKFLLSFAVQKDHKATSLAFLSTAFSPIYQPMLKQHVNLSVNFNINLPNLESQTK